MFGAANGLLKDGARHYSGLEEAMYRNIEAIQQLSGMTKSALGPHGMNKMVINHLDRNYHVCFQKTHLFHDVVFYKYTNSFTSISRQY